MSSWIESILYCLVKGLATVVRRLPGSVAMAFGAGLGTIVYYCNRKHRSNVLANLRMAFSDSKSPKEIQKIAKEVFQNYGKNIIELFRLPLLKNHLDEYVQIEGKEHVDEALKNGKGAILLAMHFGSWEMASIAGSMMGHPYKVLVKPQKKFLRLTALLNSYREGGGSSGVLERGFGTRDLVKSLHNNEVIGMVVDQGGKEGVHVPLFGREASLSSGAIRIGLKFNVPICFAVIVREQGARHRLILHPPFQWDKQGSLEEQVVSCLKNVAQMMEKYIRKYPQEYMWFYKIWKYSKESVILILDDGKTGHLRQSQALAQALQEGLAIRGVSARSEIKQVKFKNSFSAKALTLLTLFIPRFLCQGRLEWLKWFLTEESFKEVMSIKANFVVSCGSSNAAMNYLLATDCQAKSVAILKPSILGYRRFDLVILPEHDQGPQVKENNRIVFTKGAPNLITPEYLEDQTQKFLAHFSHLKLRNNTKIGFLLGGDTKDYPLSEMAVRRIIHQIKEAAEEFNADILVTTSRRTSVKIENMVYRELRRHTRCRFLIIANQHNVPEAMGGILGLSDILVVSGDSISMVSEAASSGKKTIVFSVAPDTDQGQLDRHRHKHNRFLDVLHEGGYIFCSHPNNIRESIASIMKNKIHLKPLDDHQKLLEAVERLV
ncbi:MAG: mitochondrial fission ELM1 family protein [Candidatus Omnitrophica bacterium]|nr:mitochondrial fission ELM1 family protein [Candidatus Omnitrophota bacterium]